MPMFHQTIAIGLLLSVLLSECTPLCSAGLIVPGYFAFYLNDPIRLAVVITATALTLAIEKVLQRNLILFGRRLLAIDVLLSFIFTALLQLLAVFLFPHQHLFIDSLAYFMPAVLVSFINANGLLNTSVSLALIAFLTRALLLFGLQIGWLG
ncbi:MAG TPA: poly-gamma-glutamate biosynthesis protein PgsC/CapC [bacterium]|nr:poly-gamma-glutamate biosynthesis protein PgsC/CapC [bacterium]HNT65542.1 poly-gamma-glutamate biosynthesis protein PgsC/CapC [bacterium]HOX87400.1 poly-gamma-glutamate biosynthesis protein PgsC/CapC [bacterium]HPG46861.1 poly-gamma-glutamate biosynthesis protein PgsC/CapC [bacterium]HPM99159.1 poly-gamma-glutamate biosynthesis protein PgsC/CapC [bacterium]